ncbi:MAG: hypothetical protein A3H98_11915 [Bacteroidetes bacterium RIFCSPLOWO2_02_FULL_36_8]|nr:MAG: hypothetical protein A3H98_11915 [Bacteroidetes bacterium RIFCSPLOWO2_02_FULL_36_8]OFY69579.1 MAG: hypothetical protein A3G23_11115 [Bacteroidetes bacterium RIFCSPLOWO2_12_FULL_37_12]
MKAWFFIFLLFFQVTATSAQKKNALKKKSEIVLYQDSITIYANIYMGKLPVFRKEDALYYWTANEKIQTTRGDYDGKLLHGIYKEFYFNNSLKQKGKFNRGKKTGIWKSWHSNGEIRQIARWRNSRKNGASLTYDVTHTLLRKEKFKDDLLNGWVIDYDRQGKVIKKIKYKNGILLMEEKSSPTRNKTPKKQIDNNVTREKPIKPEVRDEKQKKKTEKQK